MCGHGSLCIFRQRVLSGLLMKFLNGRIVGGNLSWKEDTWKNTIKSAEMLGFYWIITNAECKLGTWYKLNS